MRKLRRAENRSLPPARNSARGVRRLARQVAQGAAATTLAAVSLVPFVAEAANLTGTPPRPSPHALKMDSLSDAFSPTPTAALRERLGCSADWYSDTYAYLGAVEHGERQYRKIFDFTTEQQRAQLCAQRAAAPTFGQRRSTDATLAALRSRLGEQRTLPLQTARVAFDYLVERGMLRGPDGAATPLLREYLALVDAPLDPSVDRSALLSELVYDVAAPFLGQRGGTCVGNAMAQFLAVHHSAEYVRLTRELASPDGVATTVTGVALRRLPSGPVSASDSLQTRLLIPALMDLANGALGYRSDGGVLGDQHTLGPVELKFTGLAPHMAEHALEALTGDSFTVRSGMWLSQMDGRAELQAAIERAEQGETTLLYWEPLSPPNAPPLQELLSRLDFRSHGSLLLGRAPPRVVDGRWEPNRVRLLDPNGFIRELPEDVLAQRLDAVVYREG